MENEKRKLRVKISLLKQKLSDEMYNANQSRPGGQRNYGKADDIRWEIEELERELNRLDN